MGHDPEMMHFIEDDEGIFCLEQMLEPLKKDDRDRLITFIILREERINRLDPPDPFDGKCPGCGREAC
jgi:hypothetical protein